MHIFCRVHVILRNWGKRIPDLNNAHERLHNSGKQVGNSGKRTARGLQLTSPQHQEDGCKQTFGVIAVINLY